MGPKKRVITLRKVYLNFSKSMPLANLFVLKRDFSLCFLLSWDNFDNSSFFWNLKFLFRHSSHKPPERLWKRSHWNSSTPHPNLDMVASNTIKRRRTSWVFSRKTNKMLSKLKFCAINKFQSNKNLFFVSFSIFPFLG